MPMAESERRAGKTPLVKQPEVEEEEETDGSPNSDTSDLTITAETETPAAQFSSGSPDAESPSDAKDDVDSVIQPKTLNHVSSLGKGKTLVRHKAFCEDPLVPTDGTGLCAGDIGSTIREENPEPVSGQGRLEKVASESSDAGTLSSLSRDSSVDAQYKDSTGIDLEDFIKKTLNKSTKDRKMLLQLERDFKNFINNPEHSFLKLAEMSSYDRMLVHRVAAFFGLDHNVDQSGKCVIVSKTKITRIPDFVFDDFIQKNDTTFRQLLKRKENSLDERESSGLVRPRPDSKSKSLEERQRSYEEAKARIFNHNGEGQEDGPGPVITRGSKSSLIGSKEDCSRPWSSTESSGYGTDSSSLRHKSMKKSYSYGGVPQQAFKHAGRAVSLNTADSICSGNSGCEASRALHLPSTPPSSQSDNSPLSRSSSTGPVPSPLAAGSIPQGQGTPVALLVATDFSSLPPGSMIINPQTLHPQINSETSMYRFDPSQPPPSQWMVSGTPQQQMNTGYQGSMSTGYTSDTNISDVCQRFVGMHVSHQPENSIMENPMGASQAQPMHPNQAMMVPNQPYTIQQQPTYMQPNYYSSTSVNQPVRFMQPVQYIPGQHSQGQGQTHLESHPSQTTPIPPVGQYQQSYVPGYQNPYTNVVYQTAPSQPTDVAPNSYQQQTVYPTSHAENVFPVQYSGYSQSGYGQTPQSQMFYNVPSTSNPQMGYSFTGQGQLRPTTPPSQGPGVPNQSLAINVGQATSYGQPPGSSHGPYPSYPSPAQAQTTRPVVQFTNLPSQPPSQPLIIRPNMQVNMQPAITPHSSTGQPGQTVMGIKTYCVQKSLSSDAAKETPQGMYPHMAQHVTCPTPLAAGPGIRPSPQMGGGGDLRMITPTGFRPQLQPLQFTQRTHPPAPQPPTQMTKQKTAINHAGPGRSQRARKPKPGKDGITPSNSAQLTLSAHNRLTDNGTDPSGGAL